jgi:hypothetical protein
MSIKEVMIFIDGNPVRGLRHAHNNVAGLNLLMGSRHLLAN